MDFVVYSIDDLSVSLRLLRSCRYSDFKMSVPTVRVVFRVSERVESEDFMLG